MRKRELRNIRWNWLERKESFYDCHHESLICKWKENKAIILAMILGKNLWKFEKLLFNNFNLGSASEKLGFERERIKIKESEHTGERKQKFKSTYALFGNWNFISNYGFELIVVF